MPEYVKIGTVDPERAQDVCELVVSDYVKALIPPKNSGLETIDPSDYYITSGDAIQKAEQLYKDMSGLAVKVQQMVQEGGSNPDLLEFSGDCSLAVASCRKMRQDLELARGTAVFLETEWEFGKLLVIPKNPRAKK